MHLDPELIDELNLLRRFSMGGPVAMDVHDNPDPAVTRGSRANVCKGPDYRSRWGPAQRRGSRGGRTHGALAELA